MIRLPKILRFGLRLLGITLILVQPLPTSAAGAEPYPLGEAVMSLPDDWTITNQRRGVEVDLTGPDGQSLMIYWWFPDEPLTGYDGAPPAETRNFPAGPALMRREMVGTRATVSAVFEWLNSDGERLAFLLESETQNLAAVEAALIPLLQSVTFEGTPPTPAAADLPAAKVPATTAMATTSYDAAGDFSFLMPKDWALYGSDMPGLRLVTLLPPTGDALIQFAISSDAPAQSADSVIQNHETLVYQEQVIPRQIDAESFDPVGGFAGHAVTLSARVYAIGSMSLPYTKATAWIFRGTQADKAVLITMVHAADAPETQRRALKEIAASLVLGGSRQTSPAPSDTTLGQPAPKPASPAIAGALDFAQALLAASPLYGTDCAQVDAAGQPAATALATLGIAVEAAAFCPGQAVPLLAIRLPRNPTNGQTGPAAMVYMRAFLAEGRRPIGLLDLEHGVLIALTPEGATGFSVALHDLTAAIPLSQPSAPPALPPFDFAGQDSPEWLPYAVQGGDFAAWTRYEAGALVVTVPEGRNTRTTGLHSAKPIVDLPPPEATESLRIRFGLDPARSSNVVFALVPPQDLGAHDWGVHEVWLALEERSVGTHELTLAVHQKVQARIPLPPAADLAALQMLIRPDGVIEVTGDQGRLLLEGRRAALPKSDRFHVQISASATQGVATGLVLKSLRFDQVPFVATGDPAAVLGDAPQEVVLFDGKTLGPHLEPFNMTRLAFGDMARFDGGALQLSLPKDQHTAEIGIFAPEALLWLDRFTKGASVKLRVEMDPAQTTGFQIALSGGLADAKVEPGKPRYLLHWRKTADGMLRATHQIDAEIGLSEATPAAMPELVELVLTPAGLRVQAVGFPNDLLPWPLLAQGQGLRLLVTAKGDAPAQAASLALRKISLIRTPGTAVLPPQPLAGVEPLTMKPLFPAGPDAWEPYDLSNMPFSETARFDTQGSLIVEKPGKYERPRAGILSATPVALLDDRLAQTPYRLALAFDPDRSDGFEVLLSNHKKTDMAGDRSVLHLSLLRNQQGPRPDDWVLTLTQRYWYTWTRKLSAQDMAAWDGRLWLDLAPNTATLTLPDIVSHRGATFNGLAKGAALYMTVHSASAIRYGPTRMALTGIAAGWVTPDGMTARQRMVLQDTSDFDASVFLDLLNTEMTETTP